MNILSYRRSKVDRGSGHWPCPGAEDLVGSGPVNVLAKPERWLTTQRTKSKDKKLNQIDRKDGEARC